MNTLQNIKSIFGLKNMDVRFLTAKGGNQIMKTHNPIENLIIHLSEAGDLLWSNVSRIDQLKRQIEDVEQELLQLRTTLECDRAKLTGRLLQSYTESEIETADTLCTRCTSKKQ